MNIVKAGLFPLTYDEAFSLIPRDLEDALPLMSDSFEVSDYLMDLEAVANEVGATIPMETMIALREVLEENVTISHANEVFNYNLDTNGLYKNDTPPPM